MVLPLNLLDIVATKLVCWSIVVFTLMHFSWVPDCEISILELLSHRAQGVVRGMVDLIGTVFFRQVDCVFSLHLYLLLCLNGLMDSMD